MKASEDAVVWGTLADETRRLLAKDAKAARRYLRQRWLSESMRSLREARQKSKLTQEQVAQSLHTTQSAIARLEKDDEGRLTLRRYIDYVLACDSLPFDIALEAFENVRAYALAHPSAPKTEYSYRVWCNANAPSPVATRAVSGGNVARTSATPSDLMEALRNSIAATKSSRQVREGPASRWQPAA